MDRRTVILWALGAGQLLAVVLACSALEWADSEWVALVCIAILYAQPYFAGIWIGFGRRSLPWRILAVAACLTGLTWVDSVLNDSLRNVVVALSPGIGGALALVLLARAFGFRLRDTTAESQSPDAARYQFSLLSLLKWTTVIAVLCSLGALANPAAFEEMGGLSWETMLLLLAFHTPIAGILFIEFAILLGMRRPWIGLAGLLPVAFAIIWLLCRNTGQLAPFLWLAGCLMVWFGVCVLPLRLFGYRFGRRRKSDAAAPRSVALEERTTDHTDYHG
jgi:hypothetical protein